LTSRCLRGIASVGFAVVVCGGSVARAQSSLDTAQSFAVLGGSTVTNTGSSVLTGDLGVGPGSAITGFPPGTSTGTIHAADAVALQAQSDVTTQYNALASAACTADLTGQDLGGMTLTTGVYCFSSSAQLTGPLTLNAQGNGNATFVFKIGTTLTTASGSSVQLTNGGNPCGVAWQIGSSATLGTTTSFIGNLIALSSITLNNGANIIGRALARNGAVTLDTNNVSFAACGSTAPPVPGPPVPALTTWALLALAGLLALVGYTTLRRRSSLNA
jgi:ice-binding like protein/exosortase sorting signal-containing protein